MGASLHDPYAVLGVRHGASTDEIEAAYRRLSMRYHPDVNPAPDAGRRMKEINAAYEILVRRPRGASSAPTWAPPPAAAPARPRPPRPPRERISRPGVPVLFVPTAGLDLGEFEAGETPLGRIEVRNLGGGLLSGTIASSVGWLRCTPATFNTNRLTIQVFASVGALAAGEPYRGTLIVRSNGGTAQVEVTARVRRAPEPELAIQPATLLLGNLPHGLVTAATVELRNVGGGMLRGGAIAHQPWLRAEPAQFLGNAVSLTVAVDLRPLTPGLDHYSAIELRTNAGTVQLPVQVYAAPVHGLASRAGLQWRAAVASGRLLVRRIASLLE